MQSLFEANVAEQIISRINNVDAETKPKWGKMNAAQMMAHCQTTFHFYFSGSNQKRTLGGFLFGRIAKRKLFSPKPWPRNLPTAKSFVVADERQFQEEKEKLIMEVKRFASEGYHVLALKHPFFGKMTSQEWSLFAYRHLDHHLQQFGV